MVKSKLAQFRELFLFLFFDIFFRFRFQLAFFNLFHLFHDGISEQNLFFFLHFFKFIDHPFVIVNLWFNRLDLSLND